jgi:3-oxoacyl-[acyl-carrier protein] reductase
MILVTGASRGLGRAICERLLARGDAVVGLARKVAGLPFPALECDVADAVQVRAAAKRLRADEFQAGPRHALVNAAGIASMNLALTTPAGVARRIVETNLLGTIHCCQQFGPLLIRHKPARIINFSSIAVALGLKGESVYAASKAGVESFTRVFAREMADFDVTVNCIAPGPIATDLIRGVPKQQIDAVVAQQVIPRQFSPDAVCDLVELLLSPLARSISGEVLHVGGA